MSLPTIRLVNEAIDNLYASFASTKTKAGTRKAVSDLQRVANAAKALFTPAKAVTVTDALDADVADFVSIVGQGGIAFGTTGRPQVVDAGTVFSTVGTGDFIDNALQAAKLAARVEKQVIDILVTDVTDATIVAFIAASGEASLVVGRALLPGDVFEVGGTGDTTDNALQTAKGSAPADADMFQVNAAGDDVVFLTAAVEALDIFEITSGTTVKFLGTTTELVISDDEVADFVSLGA